MKPLALIVEDNADFQDLLQERMRSLNHGFHMAPSQRAAQELIARHSFDYVLLDLCIPLRTGQGLPLADNGEALLEEIVAHPRQKGIPVIIWTSHGLNTYVLAARLMRKGAYNFLGKDSGTLGARLIDVIREALAQKAGHTSLPIPTGGASGTDADPVPVHAAGKPEAESLPTGTVANEMAFYPDRIELWGFRICDEKVNATQSREMWDLLRVAKPLSAGMAAKLLETSGGQNNVSQCVRRLRKCLERQFSASSSWPCPPCEVILSGGPGFRMNPKIKLVDRLDGVVPQVVARARKAGWVR